MKWISVDERLPEIGVAVLVRILNSNRPALAVLTNGVEQDRWEVQPMFTSWYTTDSLVTHWTAMTELEETESSVNNTILGRKHHAVTTGSGRDNTVNTIKSTITITVQNEVM